MIKVKFWACTIGEEGSPFLDEANLDSLENAEDNIKQIIIEFNKEEQRRQGETARLRKFIKLGEEKPTLVHSWTKMRFGQEDRAGIHDIWQCERCKIIRKIYSLDGVPRGGDCYPERTCKFCHKIYTTQDRFLKHKCKERDY